MAAAVYCPHCLLHEFTRSPLCYGHTEDVWTCDRCGGVSSTRYIERMRVAVDRMLVMMEGGGRAAPISRDRDQSISNGERKVFLPLEDE